MQKYKVYTEDKRAKTDSDGFIQYSGITMQYSKEAAIEDAKTFNGKIVDGEVHEEHICPKCYESDLLYHRENIEDNIMYKTYSCNTCGHEGTEKFLIRFLGHTENQYQIFMNATRKNIPLQISRSAKRRRNYEQEDE